MKCNLCVFVLDYKPLKADQHQVRITIGGDLLPFEDDAGSPASNILETKVLINSMISDTSKGSRFMGDNISDYFVATPMKKQNICMYDINTFLPTSKNAITSRIRSQYMDTYTSALKKMYGLKKAAILAYDNLQRNLKPFGYAPVIRTVVI